MEPVQLPVAQRAKTALAVTPEYEKQLQELAGKHRDIVAITNEDGLKQCHAARMEKKNARLAIEKRGKAAREDAQVFAKAVIGEEKRLIAIIASEEERLGKLEDDWNAAREQERQAAAKAEAARVAAIQQRITDMERLPLSVAYAKADEVAEKLRYHLLDKPESWAQEQLPAATQVHDGVTARLKAMHAAALAAEAEAQRQAEERQRLAAESRRLEEERQRIEQERKAQQEKADAEDRERRRKIDEEEAAARRRIAEEERKAKEVRDAEEARLAAERRAIEEAGRKQREEEELRALIAREAEEARQREARRKQEEAEAAERARQRAEQEAKDEAARKEREAAAERAREILRKEQARMDAYALLQSFLDLAGESEEFVYIASDIREFLANAQVPA